MSLMLALVLAAVCPAQPLTPVHLSGGEKLAYRLDALGADVGTFDVELERGGDGGAAWTIRSRARTSAFISTNVGQYDAFATVTANRSFVPQHYREDVDEGALHRSVEAHFGHAPLDVDAAAGTRKEVIHFPDATADTRDILTTLFVLRTQSFKSPVCLEVFAGRHLWKLEGSVAAREVIDTPVGKFNTLRVDAVAVRIDDPNVKRAAHVWVTDDERRIPIAAIGEMRGKTLRAQLVEATSLKRTPRASTAGETHRNAIGR